jgi:hypothetical protein
MFRKYFKIALFALPIFIISAIIGSSVYVITSNARMNANIREQAARVAAYQLNPGPSVNEQSFADFNLDINPKINEIQTLITHNSYKKNIPSFNYRIATLFKGKESMVSSYYEHNTIIDQLNNGVRGLELDIRYEEGKFMVYHMPLVDNNSSSPDFILTLTELKIWSDNNPNHVPVSILIETKDDNQILNSRFQQLNSETLELLDNTIISIMGRNKVITPEDIKGDYSTLNSAVTAGNWPLLSEAQGKFVFLLHPHNSITNIYIASDTSMESQAMFPVLDYNDISSHQAYASYIMVNTPDVDLISGLVENNYMVRTRMDSGMVYDVTQKENALSSGAQLISTDFEKGIIAPKTDYIAYLSETYTIRLNPVLVD